MPIELRVSGVGEFAALAAGQAGIEDYGVRQERESLEVARKTILAFIEAVSTVDRELQPVALDEAERL